MLSLMSSLTFCRFRPQQSAPGKNAALTKLNSRGLCQGDSIHKHQWFVYFETKIYIFSIPLTHRTLNKLKAFFGLFPWKHPSLAGFNILQEFCLGIYFSNFKKAICTKFWNGNHIKPSLWVSTSCVIRSRMRKSVFPLTAVYVTEIVWPMIFFYEKVHFQ